MAELTPERLTEMTAVCGAAAFMGIVGFLGHAVAVATEIDYRRLVGGVLLAAFTSSIATLLMVASDMNPMMAAPIGAMLGASGEYGFNFLLEKYAKKEK